MTVLKSVRGCLFFVFVFSCCYLFVLGLLCFFKFHIVCFCRKIEKIVLRLSVPILRPRKQMFVMSFLKMRNCTADEN